MAPFSSRFTVVLGLVASVALLVVFQREQKLREANERLANRILAVAALRDTMLDYALGVGDSVPPLPLRLPDGRRTTLREASRSASVLYFESEKCPACGSIRTKVDSIEMRNPGLILRIEYDPRGRDSTTDSQGRALAIPSSAWRRYVQYTPSVAFVDDTCTVEAVVHGSSDRVMRALTHRLKASRPPVRKRACLVS